VILFPYGFLGILAAGLSFLQFPKKGFLQRVSTPPFEIMIKNSIGLFYCGKQYEPRILCEAFEIEETQYLKGIHSGFFVDIGAHVGRYTIMVAHQMGCHGKVLAIEPLPANFAALQRNIKLNELSNVYALNAACDSVNHNVRLFFILVQNRFSG
jgi:hypothetical protein